MNVDVGRRGGGPTSPSGGDAFILNVAQVRSDGGLVLWLSKSLVNCTAVVYVIYDAHGEFNKHNWVTSQLFTL